MYATDSGLTPAALSMLPHRNLHLIGNLKPGPHSHDNHRVPRNVSPFLNANPATSSSFSISSSPHQPAQLPTPPRPSAARHSKSMQNLFFSVVSNKNPGQSRPVTTSSFRDEKFAFFNYSGSRDKSRSPCKSSRLTARHSMYLCSPSTSWSSSKVQTSSHAIIVHQLR